MGTDLVIFVRLEHSALRAYVPPKEQEKELHLLIIAGKCQ